MHKLPVAVFIFLTAAVQVAAAQKSIDGLINAEKSFAAYALQHNTKEAFLLFLDSADAVVFDGGKINSAFATWNNAKANSNKLSWHPAFAGIAQSGDLGFTTGPWEFRRNSNDSLLAAGSYSTVWHVNSAGEWKFLVDIGTDAGLNGYTAQSIKKWTGTTTDNDDSRDALTIDRIFIQQYAADQNDAFKAAITGDTWFNLPGQKPVTGVQNITAALAQIPSGLDFTPVGGGVSGSGDLAYVYGTVRHLTSIKNYLRVWHKQNGKYTILLQTLQW